MIYLNIGAGESWSHAAPPWINIDSRASTEADMILDVRKGLPFRDGSATLVYLGHFLEHLPLDDVPDVLAKVKRVLVPGGGLGVVGPDVTKPSNRHDDLTVSSDDDRDENPAVHSWDCSGPLVVDMLNAIGFIAVAEIPIDSALLEPYPVYDPVTADQFAVIATKPR